MSARGLKGFGRKAIAVLMALCLSVMMVPAVAFASIDGGDYEVEVDASAADASNTGTSGQNITTDKKGVGVLAKDGHTGTATVGNVSSSGTVGINGHANGGNVNITAKAITGSNYNDRVVWLQGDNATGTVTVDSVNATVVKNGYNHNYGINVDAGAGADLNVKVKDGVTLSGVQNYTTAVYAKTTQPSAKSTVEVGDVNITNGERALYVHNYNGGTAKITAGDVTATDVGTGSYTYSAVCAEAKKGTAELTMGDLKGLGGTFVGMKVYAKEGGTLTVNAGDISTGVESSTGYSGSYGLDGSMSDAGSVANVTVGNISAEYNGLSLIAYSGTTLNLKTGDVSGAQWNHLKADGGTISADLGTISGAKHTGLDISGSATAGSHYNVTTGSITSESKALSLYSYATADNPDKITVNGDLTSTGGDYNGGGIYASSSPGNIDLTVNGNVTSDYYTVTGTTGGAVHITGDVISTHDDDYVPAINDAAGKVPLDLLVEGTISANGPALRNNADSYSRLTLTAWKVASAKGVLFDGDTDGAFAKRVNYIVKAEQPKVSGVTVQVTKADGTALDKSNGLEVAHEGDKVYVQVNGLSPCVKVDKAYNLVDGEKVELPKDEKGYYYTFDRMGGGNFPLEIGGANLGVDLVDNHDWEVSWRWDGDEESGYTAASALFHCKNNSNHDQQVAGELTTAVVAPTCTDGGYTRYTATATVDGKEYSDTKEIKLTPALGHDWGAWAVTTPATCSKAGVETRTCKHDATHKQTRSTAIDPNAHQWGDWQVTKEPTPTASGVRTRVCAHNAKHKQTEAIAASGKLLVKMTAPKNNKKALTIAWSKKSGASGYEIYFAQCNHKNKKNICKKVKTVKSGKAGSWTKKGLKAGVSYKAFVMAYKMVNGKKAYADTSLTMHAYTSGGTKKVTNPKKVTVKSSKITVAKGQTSQIKAEVTKLSKSKKLISTGHAPTVRYISSDKNIAKVNKTGVVTGKKKGTCKVYAIAANGVRAAVKVTVK